MSAPPKTQPMSSREAARESFIVLLRELARTYQAFATLDARLLREHRLTSAQADVIFTLGNTEGMTLGELGERTLITKGTLTGVVDRLEEKGLVRREAATHDRRCTLAILTARGARLFERVFPMHIAALKERLGTFPADRRRRAVELLREIRGALEG